MTTYNDDLNIGFEIDTDAEDEQPEYGLIPPGHYDVVVAAIAKKATKATKDLPEDEQDRYFEIEFEIMDGPYKGRKIFQNYTVKHSSVNAVNIATQQLKQLLLACNIAGVQSSLRQCLGQVVEVVTTIEQSKDPAYPDKPRIKQFVIPDRMSVSKSTQQNNDEIPY